MPTPETIIAPISPSVWRSGADVPVVGGTRALRLDGPAERSIAFTAGEVNLVARSEVTVYVHAYPDVAKPPRAISLEFISEEKTKRLIWGDKSAFGADVAQTAIHAGPMPVQGRYTRLKITACESGVTTGKNYTGVRLAQSDGSMWWDQIGAEITSPEASDDPLLSKDAWVRTMQNSARTARATALRHDINFLVGLSGPQQNEIEKQRLTRWHRDFIYGPFRAALETKAHAVRRLLAEQVHYENTLPITLVSGERGEPLPAHVLIRGQYDKPGEAVAADTPAFLPPAAKTGSRVTRLDFARWLVSPQHPLTARVTVNRFWQQLFGAGLVRTPEDFGTQGALPTHPELLDWLASEFLQTGWNVKHLIRLIVASRTYQQDSRAPAPLLERDPDNRLLARGARLRLDAEVLRDQVLALSGLLTPDIGGPPVKPYQPVNIWEPVGFGTSNTRVYVQDHGAALYRRSLYTFWKRTAPAPAMSTFDAPSRENSCAGRARSNTPLQARALMNDVQQFEAARALAERLLLNPQLDAARIKLAFRIVTSRTPQPDVVKLLEETLVAHRAHFEKDTEAANRLVANGESKPNPKLPAPEVAAWTMIMSLLLNLDEAIVRN